MPGTTGPRLGLVWGYVPGEAGWGVGGFNPNFARLEALVHLTTVSIGNDPPGSPANGACYIVGTAPAGIWAGHAEQIAVYYSSGGWIYIVPAPGVRAYNQGTSTYWRYDGSDWVQETVPTADVSGPVSAGDQNIAIFSGTTGKLIADGGQPLPESYLVGTDDAQILTNKIIEGANNDINIRLALDTTGNLPVDRLNGGAGASATTVWHGDGQWREPAGGGDGGGDTGGAKVTISDVPPASPAVGDLWFDSDDTITLYLWMDDGTSAQWIPASNVPMGGGGDGGGGDQTITLTGDVTGTGTTGITTSIVAGAVGTAEIADGAVSYAKVQNVASARLLGNPGGSPAAPAEITLGTGLSFSGTTLNATGGGGGLDVATADSLYVNLTGDTMTGPLRLPGGVYSAPSLTFNSVNAGISGSSTNLTFSTSGTERFTIGTVEIDSSLRIRAPAGSTVSASFHFGESNTGFYGGTSISATVGGNNKLTLSATALTMAVPIILPAAVAGAASLNLPHGTAPTTPVNGDLWTTTEGLYTQISGVTVGPLGSGGGGGDYLPISGGTLEGSLIVEGGTIQQGGVSPHADFQGISSISDEYNEIAVYGAGADEDKYVAISTDSVEGWLYSGPALASLSIEANGPIKFSTAIPAVERARVTDAGLTVTGSTVWRDPALPAGTLYGVYNTGTNMTFARANTDGSLNQILGDIDVNGDWRVYNSLWLGGNLRLGSSPSNILERNTYATKLFCPDGSDESGGIILTTIAASGGTYYRNNVHEFNNWGNSATYARFNSSGTYNVSGSWLTISSQALKRDIADIDYGLSEILRLRPVTYCYAGPAGTLVADDGVRRVGLVAEEAAQVLPAIVRETEIEGIGRAAAIDTTPLLYALVRAVQQLAEELEELKR